jgi:pyruvate formate lyase activating enzyme
MAGTFMSVDEVMEEILKDEPYYRHSKGGVTFSGGEPMLQRAALLDLLRRCKEQDFHTAIQTAGNYRWTHLEELLPYIDLIMYDLKIFNPQLHRQYIGHGGERVRDNLLRLGGSSRAVIIRTPVVGGVNDTEEEISSIACFIKDMEGLLYYELLPYHALGNSKRPSLGLSEEQERFYAPSKERIYELAEVARAFVKEVRP